MWQLNFFNESEQCCYGPARFSETEHEHIKYDLESKTNATKTQVGPSLPLKSSMSKRLLVF